MPYIDDDCSPTPPVSYRDDRPVRIKNTPRRVKSISAADFQVRIPGEECKFRSIRRHKQRGTWFIEVSMSPDILVETSASGSIMEMSNLNSSEFEKIYGSPSVENLIASKQENTQRRPTGSSPIGKLNSRGLSKDNQQECVPLLNAGANDTSVQLDNRPNKLSPSSYNRTEPECLKASDRKSPTSSDSSNPSSYQTPPTSPTE